MTYINKKSSCRTRVYKQLLVTQARWNLVREIPAPPLQHKDNYNTGRWFKNPQQKNVRKEKTNGFIFSAIINFKKLYGYIFCTFNI